MAENTLTRAQRAARAAAYTVALLSFKVEPVEVSICDAPDDVDWWTPWAPACDCCSAKDATSPFSHEIAILAAEIIAHRPEKSGHGDKWDYIDLEHLDVANRLVNAIPDKTSPLYHVGRTLCGEWWTWPDNDERRHQKERARQIFSELWQQAMNIVRQYQPQINSLAETLQANEYLDDEELLKWWRDQSPLSPSHSSI